MPVLLPWILVALGVPAVASVGLVVSMVTSLVVAEVDVVAVVSVVAVVAVEGLVMLVGEMDFIVVTTAAVQYIHSSIIQWDLDYPNPHYPNPRLSERYFEF